MSLDNIPKRFRQQIQEAKEQQLEELDLSNGGLTEIPDEVFKLTHLKELNLSNNRLNNLPDSITKLSGLTKLDLSNNRLNNLPDSITNLSSLTKLDLRNSQINNLPKSITNLSNLTTLGLSYNRLTNLPNFITNLTKLTTLYLNGNRLDDLPDSITNLTKLTTLGLNGNRLDDLPDSITNLPSLTELYLSGNRLTELPNSITNLTKLTKLYLSGNRLDDLPDSITNLSSLTELYLSSNRLTKLPDSIPNLSNLTKLYLSSNRLIKLPDSITNLPNLTELYLSSNQLIKLPDSITNFSSLTDLYLINNQLIKLPESIGKLSNSTRLYLSDNPLKSPPIQITEKGIEAIREYFRQLREKGTDYIYEAKLLIVGEAGAGKTTLAKKIENQKYQLDTNEKSTEGIDITKWSFSLDNEREFKVNIWDFGGQEIYHATHQFFLTKRSLYALVVDNRKEDDNLYYWLNLVELLSDNSPLLIVKNKNQNRHRELNERALRGQFTNLEKTLSTNLATNKGLNDILKNIKHYISTLDHIGSELPKTWVKVRQALEKDKRNYISLDEYLALCQNNGFTQLKDKLQLSGYLHDLGVCLHFQEEEDSLLYKTVILKPEWGTDAVYKVLDNPQVINNQGCFTRNDLKNIWHEDKYALSRGELLELMKKFQLCYEIPNNKNTFIAPQLLSENQPDYEWDETDNLILRYAYPDFMPKGIISRFIVIMHQYIHSNNDNQCVWKTGVVLEQDNTFAEVIEYYGKREIIIRVLGNNKRGFMTIVANELDKINQSYPRLNYQKLIPCNCPTCIDDKNPYGYDFNNLLTRINDRKYTVECNKKPYHEVQILSLIDNSIDIEHLVSQAQQDTRTGINIQGDRQKVILQLRDFMTGDRHTNIEKGNYNENIKGDYYDQKENNNTISNINQSRNINISDNAQVNTSGAASFGLGDISGTVANTINQLPNFNEPNKTTLKQLLIQLHNTVIETDLDTDEKEESLAQINAIASALTNSQDTTMKRTAKRAMTMLKGITADLPTNVSMVTICNQLPDLIGQIF